VILHGCTIGDNTLIGMGAILMNGSKIGSNCVVGAGALVPEGKTFPDNSLIVGAPARVVRPIDDKATEMIAFGADIYVKRSQQYAKNLRRIG
jgi:carbonic anhydrase/acetyltransferase-like protein (isoleucine patch superfamily)